MYDHLKREQTKFCHDTSLENARNILSGECFYLNKYNAMNDLLEARLHDDEKDRIFVLSLCHSEALNIPGFYLYGGIDGKGCRIRITGTKLEKIIGSAVVYPVNKQFKKLKKPVPQDQFEILADWVYYVAENGFCRQRGEERRFESRADALKELKKTDRHYFVKSPIWEYEKEFRLVVKFREDVSYDRIALCFGIDEKERGISVLCGPETTEEELETIRKEFLDYGISNVSRVEEAMISMRLVDRNEKLFRNRK